MVPRLARARHDGRDPAARRPSGAAAVLGAVLALLLLPAAPAAADPSPPSRDRVVAMAQHLVQEQFMHGALGHYHLEFDVASLHPQPEPGYWAVVGGFVSHQSRRNIYVAAVRLVCPDSAAVGCWRLEKLAINETIVLDLGEPL